MSTDKYRLAASMLVLRVQENASSGHSTQYQILLLHKPRKKDSWQLPQGGVEAGETIEQAALRELHEEAGVTDAKILGKSSAVYQYDFPESFRRFRPDNICGQRIEYVFAIVPPDTVIAVDQNEINDYVWVSPAQVTEYVKRQEYIDIVMGLYAEATATIEQNS